MESYDQTRAQDSSIGKKLGSTDRGFEPDRRQGVFLV